MNKLDDNTKGKATSHMWLEYYRGKFYVTEIEDEFGKRFPEVPPEPKNRRRKKGKEGG